MKAPIVHSLSPLTLVGGGAATPDDVHAAVALAPGIVAADSGATLVLSAGLELTALIGDFDSVPDHVRAQVPDSRQHRIAEQDSTDFDKALRNIAAPVVLAVGFTGARLDHQLAALHVLVAYPDRPCILLGGEEITFLCPPTLTLPTEKNDVVSLFPMADVTGASTGLRWEIDGLDFAPHHQIGTSNAAEGPVTLTMAEPAMLLMMPRRYLAAVTQALASAPPSARWPARATRYTDPPQL